MNDNNNNWIIEKDKVQVGNKWKTLDDLKMEFYFEIGIACLFVVLAVLMVSIQFIFTIVCLVGAIYMAIISVGTNSAFKALEASESRNLRKDKKKENRKEKHHAKSTNVFGSLKDKLPKGKNKEKALVTKIQTKLVKTTGQVKQDKLGSMDENSALVLSDLQVLCDDVVIGEIPARTIQDLDVYRKYDKRVKVQKITLNDIGRYEIAIIIEVYDK